MKIFVLQRFILGYFVMDFKGLFKVFSGCHHAGGLEPSFRVIIGRQRGPQETSRGPA